MPSWSPFVSCLRDSWLASTTAVSESAAPGQDDPAVVAAGTGAVRWSRRRRRSRLGRASCDRRYPQPPKSKFWPVPTKPRAAAGPEVSMVIVSRAPGLPCAAPTFSAGGRCTRWSFVMISGARSDSMVGWGAFAMW
jgi:hypothetical protein